MRNTTGFYNITGLILAALSFSHNLLLSTGEEKKFFPFNVLQFLHSRDIDMVSRIYQKQKNDPPLDRDHPPIGGKISWARQLFRRIQVGWV